MTKNDKNENISTSQVLDEEQRVRVLSPGMLVTKRFFRNRLAVIGLVILVSMFLFSFVGGLLTPYGETQVFKIYESIEKDYAGVAINNEFQYMDAEGESFPSIGRAQLVLAINNGETTFTSRDLDYSLIKEGEDFYRIVQFQDVATVVNLKGVNRFTPVDGETFSKELELVATEALLAGEDSFEFEEVYYSIISRGRNKAISRAQDISIATKKIFNTYSEDVVLDYDFCYAAEKAMNEKTLTFEVKGVEYEMELDEASSKAIFYKIDGNNRIEYSLASNININSIEKEFLSIDYREAVLNAIYNGEASFSMADKDGIDVNYRLVRNNEQYTIRKHTETELINVYESPSKKHPLGTDGNGMDILTRLMYGGRISLIIGFVVVIIEILIGVILGGLAGYFGGWVDNIIMRTVDVVYCIPSLPLYIILGSIMDFLRIDPQYRIFLLMIILALLGWPGIARMVRGQILSLREQEFMIATEALGISVRRRIFKHLVPNVIPQLTVIGSMNLGGIILTEATLSYLGLGVKFPYASWGNIINAVNNIYVMTNFWFVWIPAGLLILITVLGFNFVGDGLRDAFDPKMKR
ncbi:MAG: ABC transporter permease [Clostridiales bacterium]|mgnify:CR=1 FL=1|jgi:peptide/nickel transport system permease protein|nr:ABC transporter permease [Bacillota bacterium]NLK02965.1 ABC transporter permease [Clostridiales bacterium]